MIGKIRDFLSGRKTYLLCASGIVAALIAFVNGADVSTTVKALMEALALIFIRLGISKNV